MAANPTRNLPEGFLAWQVALRRWTMEQRSGAPHAGVAPLVSVRHPAAPLGVISHSIICGILPHASQLARKTQEFKELYEAHVGEGSRAVYDRGIDYLRGYYRSADDFDPASLTTLLPAKLPLVDALRADPRCALVFYVFDLTDRSEIGRLRCIQIDCDAEVFTRGPVYDNVWWHNTLFHGAADEHVVVHFRCRAAFDTVFGSFEELRA